MTAVNLDSTSFPLYGIQSINSNTFVCAGGGGSAKTGVKNAIHVYKLKRYGKTYKATSICEVDTGHRAVMNVHLSPSMDILAVGMDHLCQFYNLKCTKVKDEEKVTLIATESICTTKEATNNQTDDGEYQKCVRFTPDQKHVITGGSDGACKIFKYPSLELKHEIKKAHADEIDEIDVHPNSKFIFWEVRKAMIATWLLILELCKKFVSVSKDSSACLWRIVDGKKELELPFSIDKKDEDFYRFRNCRFSKNKDTQTVFLFTTNIPKKYSKEKPLNCLVKWNTSKWIPEQTVFIKNQTLSSLNTSANGRYLGVGTADGAVLIYISWNMTHLRTVNGVHDIFVTGLSFIPENKELCEDMGIDAAVLTCSIDNKCQLTTIKSRFELPFGVLAFFFVCVIIVIFNFITYYDVEF